MNYKFLLMVFVSINLSQNLIYSAKKSVSFDTVDKETVETNFMNIVASKRAMKKYFFKTQAQYISENHIEDLRDVAVKQYRKKAQSRETIACFQEHNLKNKYYCLCLQHPVCTTWKVKAFIQK